MRTWQAEGAVVASALAITAIVAGGGLRQWIGALAVQLTFHHAAIADRMAERQSMRRRGEQDVECWRWSQRLFVSKELLWLWYFAVSHAWPALTGVVLFLLYPVWRRVWRSQHPLVA